MPAVVLRMPPHRAAWFGRVLSAYTRVCRLAGVELDAAESGAGVGAGAGVGGGGSCGTGGARAMARLTSARRMAAAAVLRAAEDFDDVTMIAVVDAAARWLEEPEGDEYAYALLGAVTDGATQLRAYGEVVGMGSAETDD